MREYSYISHKVEIEAKVYSSEVLSYWRQVMQGEKEAPQVVNDLVPAFLKHQVTQGEKAAPQVVNDLVPAFLKHQLGIIMQHICDDKTSSLI